MTDFLAKIQAAIRTGNIDGAFHEMEEMAKLAAKSESYKRQADLYWSGMEKVMGFVRDMGGDALDQRLPLTGSAFMDASVAWPARWAVVKESCSTFSRLFEDIAKGRKDIEDHLERLKTL